MDVARREVGSNRWFGSERITGCVVVQLGGRSLRRDIPGVRDELPRVDSTHAAVRPAAGEILQQADSQIFNAWDTIVNPDARPVALVRGQVALGRVPRKLPILGILERIGKHRPAVGVLAVKVAPQARERVVPTDIGTPPNVIVRRKRDAAVASLEVVRILDNRQIELVAEWVHYGSRARVDTQGRKIASVP